MPLIIRNGKLVRIARSTGGTGGTGGGGGGGGGANPAVKTVTGIDVRQNVTIPAGFAESVVNKFIVADFRPLPADAAGPFVYEIVSAATGLPNSDNFTTIGSDSSRFDVKSDRGHIVVPYNTGAPASGYLLRITDAAGASATTPITFNTSGGKAIYVGANRTYPANANPYEIFIPVVLWDGAAQDRTTPVTLTSDTTTLSYSAGAGGVNLPLVANFPPVGAHTLTLSAPGYADVTFTVVIEPASVATPLFYQTLTPVSSSCIPGTELGLIVGATSTNAGVLTMNDTAGAIAVNGRKVLVGPAGLTQGSLTFTFSVADGSASTPGTATLDVVQGFEVNPDLMTLDIPAGLTNDKWNVSLGTPSVSGIPGTKRWVVSAQDGENELAAANGTPNRISANPNTGAVTAVYLSAGYDGVSPATTNFTLSCTDGIYTCTKTFPVSVAWAPVSKTFNVGPGMAAAHPDGTGFDHVYLLRDQIATSDLAPHDGTYVVNIYAATATPDYYADDTGTSQQDYAARFPWPGPIVFNFISDANGVQPTTGGHSSNNATSGYDMRGKGAWTIGNGDAVFKNGAVRYCHGADATHSCEGIRKDGNTYGNLSIIASVFENNDNGILGGNFVQGDIYIKDTEVGNAGTSHESAGACHCIYIGTCSKLVVDNLVSRRASVGHTLKTRAKKTIISNSRLYDGAGGNASNIVNIPFGGDVEIYGCKVSKGLMAQNPDAVRFCDEGAPWPVNHLNFHDNDVDIFTLPGSHYGDPCIIGHFVRTNAQGVQSTVSMSGNTLWRVTDTGIVSTRQYNLGAQELPAGSFPGATTETGTTMRSMPIAMSKARPYLPGNLPILGPFYRVTQWGGDSFRNFDNAGQWQQFEWFEITARVAVGTGIAMVHASNDLVNQGAGQANPWSPGTTWAVIDDAVYYGAKPWAPANLVTITAPGDNSGALKVGTTLAAGVYIVQVRGTAPTGEKSDWRYAVVAR